MLRTAPTRRIFGNSEVIRPDLLLPLAKSCGSLRIPQPQIHTQQVRKGRDRHQQLLEF
jgi:hypothetical protein